MQTQAAQSSSCNNTIKVENMPSELHAARGILKKYCYFSGNDLLSEQLRATTISLIDTCKDGWLVLYCYKFFLQFIHCFFFEDRTIFDRLRAYYMQQLLVTLLLNKQYRYTVQDFKVHYSTWLNLSGFKSKQVCHGLGLIKLNEVANFNIHIQNDSE